MEKEIYPICPVCHSDGLTTRVNPFGIFMCADCGSFTMDDADNKDELKKQFEEHEKNNWEY